MEMEKAFTRDGNVLSTFLDQHTTRLHEINRSSGVWGADERVQISLTAVRQLTAYASIFPGWKIVVWVSPGWPLLSGSRIDLSSKQQQQIFDNVVAFSQQLQEADVTLYNVNPLGPGDAASELRRAHRGASTATRIPAFKRPQNRDFREMRW